MQNGQGITPKILLQHMQGMQAMMVEKFKGVENQMQGLQIQITGVKSDIKWLEIRLTAQIDAIDKRLDEIEIEYLPKRVKRIERKLGIV